MKSYVIEVIVYKDVEFGLVCFGGAAAGAEGEEDTEADDGPNSPLGPE